MRIAYLTTAIDDRGGAERVNRDVLVGLKRYGAYPLVFTLYRIGTMGQTIADLGIPVKTPRASRYTSWRIPLWLSRNLSTENVDILFINLNHQAGFWGMMLRKMGKVKGLVCAVHTTNLPKGAKKSLWRKVFGTCDRVIFLSERNRDIYAKTFVLPEDRTRIIPNGIDLSAFSRLSPEARRTARYETGLPENHFIAGLVAFFKPPKNLTLFVQVCREFTERFPDSHFVLVGEGPTEKEILKAVHDLDVSAHISLPGKGNPAQWYPLFDVCLLTSSSEAFPLTLIEASASGIPAIATDVGGVADIIDHGKTGFVVPVNDLRQIVHYLEELYHDQRLRNDMGKQAYEKAYAEYSNEVMIKRYLQVFGEVYGGK